MFQPTPAPPARSRLNTALAFIMKIDPHAPQRAVIAAPWLCIGALAVVVATLFVNRFFIEALLVAPLLGLGTYGCAIWGWKKNNQVFFVAPVVAFASAGQYAAKVGGLTWGLPQMLAMAMFFWALPMWLSGRAVLAWLSEGQQAVPADGSRPAGEPRR